MCVSVGPGFPSLGPGVPPAAMSAPAASPAAACLDVPGADGGGGGEPPPPGQTPDKASGAGVTTVTSFVGSSRRHRLVRSQVNSSEYFSVSFELPSGADAGPDEFVAACRGVTLAEALQASCNRRGVDVSAVSVSVDDARTPLTADTATLAGRHIRVRVRDAQSPTRSSSKDSSASSAPLLKSVSEQSYDRGWSSGRSFFSVSTDEGGDQEAAPSRADRGAASVRSQGSSSKQRWSSLFGNSKDTKMEALVEQLKQYSESGIPRHVRADPDEYETHREELEQMGKGDWRELLCGGGAELTERRRQQQAALWELLATEAAYVQVVHVVTRLFLACLRSLQGCGLLVEVDAGRLFCNVEAVAAASLQFWVRHLAPAVASARHRSLPLDPLHLRDGFLRFHEIFQPYTRYCAEQLNCQAYCREMCRKDELFAAYLAWCEAQPACGRLRLADLLVKPMQRLTRYSLLLRAVLRHTDDEHHATALARMITSVDEFVNNVNSSLKTKQDNEKLKALIARIESYDVVEAVKDEELERLVRVHSQLDLTGPMPGCHVSQPRQLLLESDLKLREGAASKTDVRCVLVTDALLVCKPAGRRRGSASRAGATLRVVRPPYLVERLRVAELPSGLGVAVVYLSEWRTAVHAFTLSSNDPRTVRVWVEAVQRAQDLYATARMAWSPAPQLSSPLGAAPPLPLSHMGVAQQQQMGAAEPQPEWPGAAAAAAAAGAAATAEAMPHSPRLESSRSSRLSSLAHSHSSSLEMNEASSLSSASQSQSREASVDINRGSSVSSDEGLLMPHSTTATGDSRQATSPRTDRRSRLLSPTPSSLCLLQPPSFQSGLGQSLPNLTLSSSRGTDTVLASRSVTPTPRSSPAAAGPATTGGSPVLGQSPPASLLLVPGQGHGAIRKQRHAQPQHLLSPGHRGVSYPPPSPCRGSLQRATPVPQSRNPPLVKTGHVASVGSIGLQHTPPPPQRFSDLEVPLIAGVSPPSDEKPSPGDYPAEDGRGPSQQLLQSPGAGPVDVGVTGAADGGNGNGKRAGRTDNRRYKTAGAIDDIKKQESRDCSIHKRLSWNCGRQQQQPGAAGAAAAVGAGSGGGSQESVRSSSGVSSGGSAGCLLPQGAEPVQEVVYEWRRAPSCPSQPQPQGQRQLYVGTGGYYPQGGTPPLSPRAVPLEAVNVEMVHPARTPESSQGASGTPTPRAATPSPTPLEHQHHHHHRHQHHQRRPPGGLQRMKDAIVMDSPIDGSNV
ncbi:pleckstrin homology domain-containing family G member 5 [Schistocerca cancellata]|uniref:pleckstrin homology domain-containing family G member 5 n=1 Tax=Schistocerca cancellata TaxID=274614 RepID=UPI00211972FA|nr:pleckstrin homology domain-containing family G member 5 [Schistocerca cancellata]